MPWRADVYNKSTGKRPRKGSPLHDTRVNRVNPKPPPPPPQAPTIRSEYADLTETVARTAPPPETGQRFVRDIRLPGFALRITAGGVKSWVVEARMRGATSPKRRTLGRHPNVGADRARTLAIQELGRFAEGIDRLQVERDKRIKALTLGQVLEDYLTVHKLKDSSISEYRTAFKTAFEDWREKQITAITREMVEQRHNRESLRSQARANLAMRLLRALFNFAAAKYEAADGSPLVTDNPVKRLNATQSWNRVERRRGLIRLHQMPAWFDALDHLRSLGGRGPVVAAYYEFLVFTGCRRMEAQTLTWASVDLPGKLFRLPDTKNRQVHELPLSDHLVDLLKDLQAAAPPEQTLVFAVNGRPLGNVNYWQQRMVEKAEIKFSPHDLRRTFATVAEGLDVPTYALKRLMNHLTGTDVTAGYVQIDVERLRVPMQRITDAILTAAGRRGTPAKVIEFPTAKTA